MRSSPGENGLLYEPDSDGDLVAAIHRFLDDEALRDTFSQAARDAAEERDWEAATNTLRGYYKEALDEPL